MQKKTIAFLSDEHSWTYNLRREVIEALLAVPYRVVLVLPYGERIEDLKAMGCEFIDLPELDRRSTNILQELKLRRAYKRVLKALSPDLVLSYTIKPNIYGGMAAASLGIPFIANITGLGTALEYKGLLQLITSTLYRHALRKARAVFVQNETNRDFVLAHKMAKPEQIRLVPGSGVNLERFQVLPYPKDSLEFVFISRIMKEKGIDQYLALAEHIRSRYPNTKFHICGFCEDAYGQTLADYARRQIIVYHGMVSDIRQILKDCCATVHPSYYPEGMSNVLLESCACGRPIITTDRAGCGEVVQDGINGYIVRQKDAEDLIRVVERFLALSADEREKMGLAGRRFVEENFDRNLVVGKCLQEIQNTIGG